MRIVVDVTPMLADRVIVAPNCVELRSKVSFVDDGKAIYLRRDTRDGRLTVVNAAVTPGITRAPRSFISYVNLRIIFVRERGQTYRASYADRNTDRMRYREIRHLDNALESIVERRDAREHSRYALPRRRDTLNGRLSSPIILDE